MAEASAKRVTGDEPQGTMGRVQTAGEARCLLPAFLCAHVLKRDVWVRGRVSFPYSPPNLFLCIVSSGKQKNRPYAIFTADHPVWRSVQVKILHCSPQPFQTRCISSYFICHHFAKRKNNFSAMQGTYVWYNLYKLCWKTTTTDYCNPFRCFVLTEPP